MTIELTLEQAQRTVTILGQAPYSQVADIIEIIKKSAEEE